MQTFELAAVIGAEENLSPKNLERFINFIDARFPEQSRSTIYIREWAQRFNSKIEYAAADGISAKILKQIDKELNITESENWEWVDGI